MKIAIVGYGFVGKALGRFFGRCHQISVYDKFDLEYASKGDMAKVNACDLAFIATSTPTGADGLSCDISSVADSLSWLRIPTCIKSTIPPGTTERMKATANVPLAFCPEYLGERPGHQWNAPDSCGFVIIGGDDQVCEAVIAAYQQASATDLTYCKTDSQTAELVKYMENSFLATKIAFVNQFYDIAKCLKVDFHELRRLWLLDSRIGQSHTLVCDKRGFGGRCLPKDLRAIIAAVEPFGGAPFLESLLAYNNFIRASNQETESQDLISE